MVEHIDKKGKVTWKAVNLSDRSSGHGPIDITTGQLYYNLYLMMTDATNRSLKIASALDSLQSKTNEVALKAILAKKF